MESKDSDNELELVFEGPEDDSAETLRKIKGAFIADLEFGVSEVQTILDSAPLTIKKSSSEDSLKVYYKALKSAGARVFIVKEGTPVTVTPDTTKGSSQSQEEDSDNSIVMEFELSMEDEDEDNFEPAVKKPAKIYCIEETSLSDLKESEEFLNGDTELQSPGTEECVGISDFSVDTHTVENTEEEAYFSEPENMHREEGIKDISELGASSDSHDEDIDDEDIESMSTPSEERAEESIVETPLTFQSEEDFSVELEPEATVTKEPQKEITKTPLSAEKSSDLVLQLEDSEFDNEPDLIQSAEQTPDKLPESQQALGLSLEEDPKDEASEVISALQEIKQSSGTRTTESPEFTLDLEDEEEPADPLIDKDSSLLEEALKDLEEDSFDLSFNDKTEQAEPITPTKEPVAEPEVKEMALEQGAKEIPKQEAQGNIQELTLKKPLRLTPKDEPSSIEPPPESTQKSKWPLSSRVTAGITTVLVLIAIITSLAGQFFSGKTSAHIEDPSAVVASVKDVPEPDKIDQKAIVTKLLPSEKELITSEQPDEASDLAVSDPPVVEVVPVHDAQYSGEAIDDGISISYNLIVEDGVISSTNLVMMLPEPPALTPEQIVRGMKRDPWVRRIEINDLTTGSSTEGVITARGPARVYLEHEDHRKRFIAEATLSAIATSEDSMELKISVLHGGAATLNESGFDIREMANGTYAISILAQVVH